jgi:outer membrane receptor protein involved in Fe transport
MQTPNPRFKFGTRLRGLAESIFLSTTRAASFTLFVLAFASFAFAQTPDTGSIRGQILDPNGAAIVGADVAATNQVTGFHRQTTTDETGRYAITNLPLTGSYKVSVSFKGFGAKDLAEVVLRASVTADINVTLAPDVARSEVTVTGTSDSVKSDSAQLDLRLDAKEIEETPVFGRKTTYLVLPVSAVRSARGTGDLFLNNFLFIIGGAGRRQTNFIIDGSTGDDSWGRQTIFTNIPLSALQEFTVLTNSLSAQYGRSAGGAVNVVTRSGTNEYHGDFIGLWRPPGLQARPPASTLNQRTPDQLAQVSGLFSGPIVRDRTHFLLSAEYNDQKRDSVITTKLAPGVFRGIYHQELLMGRVDHNLNDRNTLTARFNFDNFVDSNPQDAVGGNVLAGAARDFRRRAYATQISETAVISPSIVNEARFQFQSGSPITQFDPVNPSTQFIRPGLSTEGESRSTKLTNHQYQLSDTVSVAHGKHSFRFGGDAIHSSSGGSGTEFGSAFVLGQFTFKTTGNSVNPAVPTTSLTIGDVASYQQSFGKLTYNIGEWLWAGFVQDDWEVTRNLTLNLGLRYDRQTYTDDRNNFGPRFGFAYNLRGDGKSVVRGSYGIYYSEIRANTEASFTVNGPTGIFSYSATSGGTGFPTSLAPLPAFPSGAPLPPRDITIRPGRAAYYSQFFDVTKLKDYPDKLLNPYTQLGSVGVEREIAPKWILSVDYVWQHTIRIDRTLDLNSPALYPRTIGTPARPAARPASCNGIFTAPCLPLGAYANESRPITPVNNGYRRILAVVNNGDSLYNAMQVNLNKRFSDKFSLLLSYTLSHTVNTVEPDAPGGDPNDANQLGRYELGDSLLDQRHRAAISGWWNLPYHFTFGGLATLGSGRPFNITTGSDLNGDGGSVDRPVINGVVIGRNSGLGNALYDFSIFLEREFRVSERVRLSLRGEGLNVFNHANTIGRNGVFGTGSTPLPTFNTTPGGVANVDPGRMFQFQGRLRF